MPNTYFQFKHFRIEQDRCAMKVTTDACILGAWAPVPAQGDFLDVGTGTGLLSLMMAQRSQGVIDAIELDRESFSQAKENVEGSKWKNQIHATHDDVRKFSPVKKYDFIICNPPFFQNQLKSSSPKKNIARHDSSMNDADLIDAVKRLLNYPEGKFALLLPFNQSESFTSDAERNELFLHQKLLICDQPEKDIIRSVMVFGCVPPFKIEIEKLTIRNNDDSYSQQFIALLKDFYLYL